MIIYDNIYDGEDKSLSEKCFLEIMSSLEKAKENKSIFFLISSDIVFDRKIDKQYTERSLPNGKTSSALFLIEAEKKVLQYSKGYVCRRQDLLSDFFLLAEKMRKVNIEPVFSEEKFRIISNSVYSDLFSFVSVNFLGERKLIHLAVPTEIRIGDIWFLIKNKPFSINNERSNFSHKKYNGYIYSEILSTFDFYKGLLNRNKCEVVNFFKNTYEQGI